MHNAGWGEPSLSRQETHVLSYFNSLFFGVAGEKFSLILCTMEEGLIACLTVHCFKPIVSQTFYFVTTQWDDTHWPDPISSVSWLPYLQTPYASPSQPHYHICNDY